VIDRKTLSFDKTLDVCQANRKERIRWLGGHLPTLHAMGYTIQMIIAISCAQEFGCFTPTEPAPPVLPTPDRILEVARLTKSDGIVVVPSFIEVKFAILLIMNGRLNDKILQAWAHSEETIKYLATVKFLVSQMI
jgi:hypothetical protein